MIDTSQIPSAFLGEIIDRDTPSETQIELARLCQERTRLTELFQSYEWVLPKIAHMPDAVAVVVSRMNRTAARLERLTGLIQQAARNSEPLRPEVEE